VNKTAARRPGSKQIKKNFVRPIQAMELAAGLNFWASVRQPFLLIRAICRSRRFGFGRRKKSFEPFPDGAVPQGIAILN
jgi:hypothetical protein